VAQQLRAIQPEIRVLYMSGYAQPVLTSEAPWGSVSCCWRSPFSETMLLDKVREALAG